jgi:hypothetical protein
MKQSNINKLKSSLQLHFQWNKARLGFLLSFTTSLIICSTVKLNRIALFINSNSKTESNYRRIQNFFLSFKMDYQQYASFVIAHLPSKQSFYLVMDRTNWKFGKRDINILMLGIIYKKMCFPLYWILLDKGGSSSTSERKHVLAKAIGLLGKQRIKALLADREFIGVRWIQYLMDEQIEFHIRVPKQVKSGSILERNRKSVTELFRYFKPNVGVDRLRTVKILGYDLHVSGMRTKNDYCIVISSKDNYKSLEKYQLRWTIENMFGAFKSRGFNFEDTHMTDLEKLRKLIVLISIVYLWCVMIGLWYDETTPIKLTNFGRKRISVFKYGFNYLTAFIKKLFDGYIYNDYEFNEVIKILSCT